MSVRESHPHLWMFFEGAFSANSGGHAEDSQFTDFTKSQLDRAERELVEFCPFADMAETLKFAQYLGMMADSGYEVHGQTMQEHEVPNDEVHKLYCFVLLDTRY